MRRLLRLAAGRRRRPDPRPQAGRSVAADERGVTAVEFAFVSPVLILLCIGVFQLGMLMFVQNSLQHVAREASRRLAVGEMKTGDAAAWIGHELPTWLAGISAQVVTPTAADPEIRVAITAPMPAAAIVDPLGIFEGRTLSAAASARAEWL
jgi:hypothetical protein